MLSLKRLFSLAEFRDHLTFKGGTSLSKVYHVIERFSEDVDVAIERGFLGFGGDIEPERGASGKEQQRRVESLKTACQATIAQRFGGLASRTDIRSDCRQRFVEPDGRPCRQGPTNPIVPIPAGIDRGT